MDEFKFKWTNLTRTDFIQYDGEKFVNVPIYTIRKYISDSESSSSPTSSDVAWGISDANNYTALSVNGNVKELSLNGHKHSVIDIENLEAILDSKQDKVELDGKFIRKDIDDFANGYITFNSGFKSSKTVNLLEGFVTNEGYGVDGEGNGVLQNVTIHAGIQSPTFTPGFLGEGFKLWTDEFGETRMVLDHLMVRKNMDVFQLTINKIQHVGGAFLFSPAAITIGRVEELSDVYRCYIEQAVAAENAQGKNLFLNGSNFFLNGSDQLGIVELTSYASHGRAELLVAQTANFYRWTQLSNYTFNWISDYNKEYTLSVDVRAHFSNPEATARLRFDTGSSEDGVWSSEETFGDTNGEWIRINTTLVVPENPNAYRSLYIFNFPQSDLCNIGDYIEYRNFKLEKGFTSTPYTVAPEQNYPSQNNFAVFDQAICQTFTNSNTKRYWRLVTNVASDRSYIDLSKTDMESGSAIPVAGDVVVQLGHRSNIDRQNAILISSYGNDGPYQQFLKGVNSYSLVNKIKIQIGKETFFHELDSFTIKTGGGQSYPIVIDRGAWAPGTYYPNERVSHNGSLWLMVGFPSTTLEPADGSPAWEEQVTRGQDGQGGEAALLLYLSSTSNVMTFAANNTPWPASQTITIVAKIQNTTGTAVFTATPFIGTVSQPNFTLGGSGNTRTLTQNQWNANWDRVVITATLGTLSDTITIVKLREGAGQDGQDGENALVGFLTNEAATLPASTTGVVSDFSGASGQFKVFYGLADVTTLSTFSRISPTSNVTATITSSGAYSVSAMSSDQATVTFRAIFNGVTIEKTLSLSKSRAGADGTSITLVDVEFAKNTSPTTAPTAGWTTTAPTLTGTEQLWTRTKTSYSSGNPTYSTPANITPKKGDTGAVGQGVESVTEEYHISSSKTTQPAEGSAGWSTTQPTWVQGQYIWSRVKVVYKNPTSTVYTGYAVSSEWEAVNELEIGGRNLYKESSTIKTYNKGSDQGNGLSWANVIEDGVEFTRITPTNNGNFYFYPKLNLLPFVIKAGEKYTISFKYRTTQLSSIGLYNYLLAPSVSAQIQPSSIWTLFSKTYEVTADIIISGNKLLGFASLVSGRQFDVRDLKLEKGNKATDWTPAPEDVQAEIDAAVVKATYWSVKASSPVIYKDAINAGTSGAHTTVVVSGELRSGTTTTQGGFITVTPNGGTEAGAASASPVTIAPANGDGKTSYTVKLYDTASKTTLLDTQTIPVVFKGASGINAINASLSNEADVLPASPEGVVSDYTGSGTTIRVFEGATELTYGTGNGQYQVSASGSGISVGTPSTVGNTRVYGVASNMTSDNATITFTITGKTASGTSFSLTKAQTFAKSRTGQKGDTGASAPLLYLSASAQVMKCNPDNTPQAGQTISIEAKLQNVSGTATFVATPYNDAGTALTAITLGGSGNTRTLTNAQWLATYKRIEIAATLGSLNDKVTIYRVADGATGATGKGISGTEIRYQVGASGTTAPTGTWLTSVPTVPEGQFLWTRTVTSYTDGTSTTSYSVSKQGVSGSDGKGISSTVITYQASSSGTVVPTGAWSGTIPSVSENQFLWTRTVITYTDSSTSTSYSVGKMGAKGDAGQNAIVGLLTNESVTLQANNAGVVSSFTPANGEFWVYNGTTRVTTGITFSKVSNTGCTATINSSGAYSVSAMSSDQATVTFRAIFNGVTIDKILTLSKSKQGVTGPPGQNGEDGKDGENGEDISSGRMMFKDPEFKSGNNGLFLYNNADGVTTLTRISKATNDTTTSAYMMRYTYTSGSPSPGFGGFRWGHSVRYNAVYITKIIAKIPIDKTINWGSNAIGEGSSSKWLTSRTGTGKFETYLCKVTCGTSGALSTTNFFYFTGGSGAFSVDIAYATVYDMSSRDYLYDDKITQYDVKFTQTDNEISARVTKTEYNTFTGSVSQQFGQINTRADNIQLSVTTINNGLTQTGIDITANEIRLYSGNSSSGNRGKIIITGSNFSVDTNGHLIANSANISGTITASAGSIGGWQIGSGYLYNNTTAASGVGLVSTATGSSPVIYAGQTYTNRTSAPFRITADGELVATKGSIGGWTIANEYLYQTNAGMVGNAIETAVTFFAGSTYANRASAPFRVTANGILTASGVNITGTITATAGKIADFDISGSALISNSTNANIQFNNINNGASFITLNGGLTSGALVALRTDVASRYGIDIQTYASGARGLNIIANAGSSYAIHSAGGHRFLQRSGEVWNAPGVLAAGSFWFDNSNISSYSYWAISSLTVSVSKASNDEVIVTHNLYHINYEPMIWREGGSAHLHTSKTDTNFRINGIQSGSGRVSFIIIGRNKA